MSRPHKVIFNQQIPSKITPGALLQFFLFENNKIYFLTRDNILSTDLAHHLRYKVCTNDRWKDWGDSMNNKVKSFHLQNASWDGEDGCRRGKEYNEITSETQSLLIHYYDQPAHNLKHKGARSRCQPPLPHLLPHNDRLRLVRSGACHVIWQTTLCQINVNIENTLPHKL